MARSAFRVRILIRFEISPDSVGSLDPDSGPVPKAKIPRKTKRNFILKSYMFSLGWDDLDTINTFLCFNIRSRPQCCGSGSGLYPGPGGQN
jgi:hypothetical protein